MENRTTTSVSVPGLEDGGLGEAADVVGDDEGAERATTFGVGLALRDALAVEVGHLLNQIEVLQQDGTVGTDGERMLLAGDGDAGVGGGGWPRLRGAHRVSFHVRSSRQDRDGTGADSRNSAPALLDRSAGSLRRVADESRYGEM